MVYTEKNLQICLLTFIYLVMFCIYLELHVTFLHPISLCPSLSLSTLSQSAEYCECCLDIGDDFRV